jgi:DNA-binding SARP family transcriptional activator
VVALLEQIRAACYLRRRRFPDSAPTLFVLDEVANIAPLPTLPQLASEGVSQGVVTLACLQDLSQARQRWGAVADGFFSLFGTKLIFPGIADHATLELISALLGDEQVAMRSVSTPQAPHWGVEVLGALLKAPRRDHTPVVTHSAIFRRRMPVDEVYRGRPGHALLLSPTQWGYSGTAPWWALKDQPIVLGAGPPWQESAAKSSPWATPGSRVVPHDDPLERAPRIEVVPGQPPPPPVPPPVDEHGVGNAHHSGPASLVPALTGATVSGGPETPTRGALSSDRVMVRVLGPVEVVGWREAPSRRLVTELACFLALHDERNMSGEEVRAALWPGDLGATEVNAKSLRNTVSLLRKALGHDLVPEAQKGSGYKFAAGVLCDWTLFSDRVESATGPREIEELRAALSLVRGAPFEGVAPGSFTWAWTELFVSRMEVAIASAARRLGELALAQNDAELSTWAALQGLSATPYDHELWSMYLNASARSGRDALERSWKSARAVLGDGVRDLTPLFERLRGHQAQT